MMYADDRKQIEAYMLLVRLFETPHADNNKILKALIFAKDDHPPLYDGFSRTKVGISKENG